MDQTLVANLRPEITVVAMMIIFGMYHVDNERAQMNESQKKEITKTIVIDADYEAIMNSERFSQASTFIFAKVFNYQTNHAIGGNPMQASMAATVGTFHDVRWPKSLVIEKKNLLQLITTCIYWELRPANEAILISLVIKDSRMIHAHV
ncbi:putative effector protein [Erysiphe neolycopersici]|uniref:Putative effector protein n=1 Tax=Erysiphe neolycopersici TaxID=212602 RepID=A0A420HKP3_9PEZI|nr:putative effector protein [Erysiphe neolycopersici]